MLTPAEVAAEHARAMRIVKAVLVACDARAATARAARAEGFAKGGAPWVLAIGKAAIGMAEGMKDVCGEPRRHLIVTVEGPPAGSLANIHRSDHPLPTLRSIEAGGAVKRFVEEARSAHAPGLTVLMSGGASALICEPIPGLELEEYRDAVRGMLESGWDIQRMNTVRRAVDRLKGGRLAGLAASLPVDLVVISDVIGDALHDVGSGPFVRSPTCAPDARDLLERGFGDRHAAILTALSCQPSPPRVAPPRRSVVALNNAAAVRAAGAALRAEGLSVASDAWDVTAYMTGVGESASEALSAAKAGEAVTWGGEWDVALPRRGFGGRAQAAAVSLAQTLTVPAVGLVLASDGVDGLAPPGESPAAGAVVWTGMYWPDEADEDEDDLAANSYTRVARRDAHRPKGEPPAHLLLGPTGVNVNDVLIAWRVK